MRLDQVKTQVLLLHSEQSTLDNLSTGFTDDYTVHCATSGTEALNTLGETPIHVIVSAQRLPGMSGVEALREAKKRSPETIGILLAGHDDADIEALVGDMEVFQIVRGGISAEEVSKLVDNATQQMRLLALAESANDTAANPDHPISEHIIMETSENGSAIISDGTGSVPVLDPQKISVAAAAGARAIDVLVLTKDDEFLSTVRESSRGMHNIRYANTLAQAEQAISKHTIGVAVVDAAMAGTNVEKLTQHLRSKASRLVCIVAGRRDDGEMLMDLINRGKVYRFLLKPVSPGRARLAVEASVKHHLEAPDSAFKLKGKAQAPAPKPVRKAKAAPKPAPKPAPRPKAAPKPAPKPAPKAKAAPKPAPKPAPRAKAVPRAKAKPAPGREKIQITPSFDSDRLAAAFDGDDSSFTETITGIVANIGEKFSSRNEKAADPAPTPTADMVGTGESPFGGSKILGIGAVTVAAVVAVGVWTFVGFDDTAPPEATGSGANPVREAPAMSETRPDTGAQDGITSSEIELALATAEAAMLARRNDDATAALDRVAEADPSNARLPFLLAQLSQMKLREYLENARAAIRESRLEDAAIALGGARALDVSDTFEIDSVAEELAAAHNEQRVEDVLAQAADRLEQGKLLSPANDNAGYFYERVLATDPDNAAAQQGLNIIAGKLVLQARTEIDENRFDNATNLLNDARGLDPSSEELAAASRALTDAQDRIADENFRKEAALLAAAKLAEDKRIAAERKATADRVAAAQRKEEARLAAERKAEADRIAVAQRKEDERLAAERKVEADRQAEADRVAAAQRKEDERLAAERKAEADRQAEADRVAAAQREENERLAAAALLSANKNATAAASDSLRNRNVVAASVGPERPPVQEKPEEVVGVSSLTRVKYVAPKYPRAAERRSLSGWVDVVFTVATDGTTKNIDVPNSEPGEMFVKSAIRAVEKWEFMPVFHNGTVVERRAGVRMMFAIE